MGSDRTPHSVQELVDLAARYWAGEAEVVRTYFSRPRTADQDIHWLRFQCYKEFHSSVRGAEGGTVRGPLRELGELALDLRGRAARAHFAHELEELGEEFSHYAVLAEILEDLQGSPVAPDDLTPGSEEISLAAMRRQIVEAHGDFGALVCKFTEGGGSGMFAAGKEIGGNPLDDRLAAAFRLIFDDEVDHMRGGASALADMHLTDEDWELAKSLLRQLSMQRVRMRNEMFGHPLDETRLEEIDRGEIEPFHQEILGAGR